METVEQVLKVFTDAEGPMRPGEVAERAGLERKDVDKAMKTLKDEDKIVSPKRCFWEAK